ncbi:TonB family protein [Bacteroidota bacterium]
MSRNKRGIVGTVVFHAGILSFLIFFGFMVPDPPPDEEGILINFGTDETGAGDQEPMFSEIPEVATPPPQEASTPTESTEEIISQDFEEAPVVEAQEEITQEEIIETPVEEVIADAEETPPPPEEEPPVVNERALYKGRANTDETTGSEGITQGEGNQGSITGSPDSDNYSEGLSSGSGGIDFSLTGRNPVSLPKPEYNVQEEGKVVVKIRVNREGIVSYAEAGAPGTNTLNKELLEAARKAALKARFNPKTDAAYTQQGTITYHFILQ